MNWFVPVDTIYKCNIKELTMFLLSTGSATNIDDVSISWGFNGCFYL